MKSPSLGKLEAIDLRKVLEIERDRLVARGSTPVTSRYGPSLI